MFKCIKNAFSSDMSNHDERDSTELQEYVKKQLEDAVAPYKAFHAYFKDLYKQGLRVSNWNTDSKSEPFDKFFEEAMKAAKKEVDDKWKSSQDGG